VEGRAVKTWVAAAIGGTLGAFIGNAFNEQLKDKPEFTKTTLAKIHECHDKGRLAVITHDENGEYVVCNKTSKEWNEIFKGKKRES
jgi:hypothetical protein